MSTISSIIWNLWKIVLFSWRCFACASLLVKNHGQNLPKWDEKKERLQYKNEEYRNSFSGKFSLDMLIRKLDFLVWKPSFLQILHLCSGESLSPEECKALGFIKSDLLCSSCDDLSRFKVSSSITSNCRQCCNDDGRKLDEGTSKYPFAILEVCGWRLGMLDDLRLSNSEHIILAYKTNHILYLLQFL